jgi:general secretion pathway protein I|tara:strand:+ start:3711 stop:4094 length:384 start_codon:yes stop_codon:yes gene_type:complete
MNSIGFTLIEILIALFIFAVVSKTLITSATQSVSQTGLVQDKTIAHWIALNELSQIRSNIRLEDDYPQTGTTQTEVNMLNSDWLVEVEVSATENDNVRRISVDVFRDELDRDEEYSMITLTSFVGKY